ncbi:hypothetical protein K437DRAFT_146296 [Tilletiaria anomala UBC 951]|uniref:Uncharacterized protein n=1 Tax=Tilletiaria anomala (strain ATCC 24038 / CBS 436.72 / UBC 951) TaxID=1037660 RepID=A0A066VY91_TILAU|nr:uncharacterized protein K437DRAFT_146296 [Tilletiaria anomala UBC 951]KDN43779.1 hypothetical protein K437DRAFT_146296 [Tilletiaria anomala UBC 951]
MYAGPRRWTPTETCLNSLERPLGVPRRQGAYQQPIACCISIRAETAYPNNVGKTPPTAERHEQAGSARTQLPCMRFDVAAPDVTLMVTPRATALNPSLAASHRVSLNHMRPTPGARPALSSLCNFTYDKATESDTPVSLHLPTCEVCVASF